MIKLRANLWPKYANKLFWLRCKRKQDVWLGLFKKKYVCAQIDDKKKDTYLKIGHQLV